MRRWSRRNDHIAQIAVMAGAYLRRASRIDPYSRAVSREYVTAESAHVIVDVLDAERLRSLLVEARSDMTDPTNAVDEFSLRRR